MSARLSSAGVDAGMFGWVVLASTSSVTEGNGSKGREVRCHSADKVTGNGAGTLGFIP